MPAIAISFVYYFDIRIEDVRKGQLLKPRVVSVTQLSNSFKKMKHLNP